VNRTGFCEIDSRAPKILIMGDFDAAEEAAQEAFAAAGVQWPASTSMVHPDGPLQHPDRMRSQGRLPAEPHRRGGVWRRCAILEREVIAGRRRFASIWIGAQIKAQARTSSHEDAA
jgi:hypothetical protein